MYGIIQFSCRKTPEINPENYTCIGIKNTQTKTHLYTIGVEKGLKGYIPNNSFLCKWMGGRIFFFFLNFWLHWVLIAARRLSFSCGEWGLLFVVVHGLQAHRLQQLWRMGSVVVARGLSCSAACGFFPDQGSNPCPLPWQADS